MDIGIFFPTGSIDPLIKKAQLAEELGYSFVGLGDSQCIFREVYSSLAVLAKRTSSVQLGPAVTNPITRHPTVTASSICTIDEMSDGRALLGIGSGDSAVYTLGKRPSKLAETEATIEFIRQLCAGKIAEYEGEDVRLKWLQRENALRDVPIYLGAEGPKTLKLAGSIADGVFIGTGLFPEMIEDSIERVNEGAREADRDPADIDKWILAKSNVRDDSKTAVDEIKMALAASANHAFRYSFEDKNVPEEYKEPIRQLQDEYVPHEHEELGETTNRELVERLGLTEYLADRFAIVGTPEECIDKFEHIEDVDGVDGVLLTAITEDEYQFVEDVGRDVLPAVR